MFRRALVYLILITGLLAACQKAPPPTHQPPSTPTPTAVPPPATPLPSDTPAWFHQAVLYQIFPRSFYDSNGDGTGDLAGITQQLDYVHNLGITTLWLTPVFSATSPHGYDVTDHSTIAPDLGTRQDLLTLVSEAHARDMRVLIDLVAGRTSKEHIFFQDAYRKPDSVYSNWYQWEDSTHTAYKAASSDKSDPLLNMNEPTVQKFMLDMTRYWMDLDDDGDLTDSIDGFVNDARFAPPEFWKALRDQVKAANPDFLLLGYIPAEAPEELAPYYDGQFDAMLDIPLYHILSGHPDENGDGLLNNQEAPALVADQLKLQAQLFPPSAQVVRFAESHSTNRIASEVEGNMAREKQAAMLILTLPGTPMIYYGQEIGMKGSLGAAPGDPQAADQNAHRREPMDWYAAESGPGMPTWFKSENRNNRPGDGISVEEQRGQKSLLEFYRATIALRHLHPALSGGSFQAIETEQCNTCLAYWRWDENNIYLVLFNFASETQAATIDFTAAPRSVRGAGKDMLRGGVINVPSNGRYTATTEASSIRILYWGEP